MQTLPTLRGGDAKATKADWQKQVPSIGFLFDGVSMPLEVAG